MSTKERPRRTLPEAKEAQILAVEQHIDAVINELATEAKINPDALRYSLSTNAMDDATIDARSYCLDVGTTLIRMAQARAGINFSLHHVTPGMLAWRLFNKYTLHPDTAQRYKDFLKPDPEHRSFQSVFTQDQHNGILPVLCAVAKVGNRPGPDEFRSLITEDLRANYTNRAPNGRVGLMSWSGGSNPLGHIYRRLKWVQSSVPWSSVTYLLVFRLRLPVEHVCDLLQDHFVRDPASPFRLTAQDLKDRAETILPGSEPPEVYPHFRPGSVLHDKIPQFHEIYKQKFGVTDTDIRSYFEKPDTPQAALYYGHAYWIFSQGLHDVPRWTTFKHFKGLFITGNDPWLALDPHSHVWLIPHIHHVCRVYRANRQLIESWPHLTIPRAVILKICEYLLRSVDSVTAFISQWEKSVWMDDFESIFIAMQDQPVPLLEDLVVSPDEHSMPQTDDSNTEPPRKKHQTEMTCMKCFISLPLANFRRHHEEYHWINGIESLQTVSPTFGEQHE